MKSLKVSASLLLLILSLSFCNHPEKPVNDPVAGLYSKSIVIPDITYLTVDSIELKLDAYVPAKNTGGPPWVEYPDKNCPVLLYIHGGGWSGLNKSIRTLNIMPYVDKGFAVVNIDYRLIYDAPFPACIADCRYALNWIYDHAAEYKFDTTRIVVSGESAGGHLALMTGLMQNDSNIYIPGKPITRNLKVSAIINWFGISDMKKLCDFWNSPDFTKKVVGDLSKKDEILILCSPLTYINSGSAPVLTIHGDADSTVPILQATLLHDKLNQYKVQNKLLALKGKKHGDFDETEMSRNFDSIWKFLDKLGIFDYKQPEN